MKTLTGVYDAPPFHWVGDGFHVRSLFSYNDGANLSPFILLDHAAPREFTPTEKRRGVGWHPHRGFETVTIVFDGEVEHHDSLGNGGVVGPGDVQWMTAAGGILHEEFHSENFSRTGGKMHMVQLWVNLPAKDKMNEAGYQNILKSDIPIIGLPNNGGRVRVISGAFGECKGPAKTHSPMDVLDATVHAGNRLNLNINDNRTLTAVVLDGTIRVNESAEASNGQLVTFDRKGPGAVIDATSDAHVLVLSGEPLDEPVFGYGPFVMNTRAEIVKAIEDFNSGKFGPIPN